MHFLKYNRINNFFFLPKNGTVISDNSRNYEQYCIFLAYDITTHENVIRRMNCEIDTEININIISIKNIPFLYCNCGNYFKI